MEKGLGGRLRKARMGKGLSLSALARISGVDRGTIGKIERGEQMPHTPTFVSLMRALKVPVAEITNDPRLLEAVGGASVLSGSGSDVGIEDHLTALIAHVKKLKGSARSEFVRAVTGLFGALEHARPAAGSGAAEDDER